jgi:hypothetical protein
LKARAACQQDSIDPNGALMLTMVGAWEEALAAVPTDYLNQCYLFALRNHDSSFPLGVGEIANAWEKNGKAWLEEARARAPERERCEHCGMEVGRGMEIVIGPDGRSKGARPCPVCNFERLAKWS